MNKTLITNWNAVVKPTDEVWHLGDFALTGRDEMAGIFNQLNGKINLILGNHDRSQWGMAEVGFGIVTHEAVLNGTYLTHDPIEARARSKPALVGHVHEKWKVKFGCVNVGVDQWDYRPVPWATAVSLLHAGGED